MSIMLTVVVATNTVGWTAARETPHACPLQHHKCTPSASLTCCRAQAPVPVDPAQVPQVAPPSPTSPPAALMDILDLSWTRDTPALDVTSVHWLRVLDLGLLHHTFLI